MRRIILVILALILLAGGWFWYSLRPVAPDSADRVPVAIEPGTSVKAIAAQLQEKGVLRSPFTFQLYVRLKGQGSQLKAGTFLFGPGESASQILEILRTGKSEQVIVTIPEGYTVSEIDALLASKGLGKPGELIDCAFHCDFATFDFLPAKAAGTRELGYGSRLEGYLFPDTYFLDVANYQPKFFLERMLGTFRKRIITNYADQVRTSGKSMAQVVTMASLVESESRAGEERPIIAGILWKRLEAKIGLGVDAANRYMLNKPTEALTQKDLDADSPYNTRKYRGLPPSPISNPGITAFEAALHPVASEYLYYLHGSDGRVHYAVTNDEHNQNRARYLK